MEEKLKRIVSSVLNIDASTVCAETSPQTVETWDSLHHMSLIVAIEEEFGVEFSDSEVPQLFSYRALLENLQKKL